MTLKFKLFDLKIDKIASQKAYELHFSDEFITYKLDCTVNKQPVIEDGQYASFENVEEYEWLVAKRSEITCIRIINKSDENHNTEHYEVIIYVNGGSDIVLRFQKKAEATALSRILRWFIDPTFTVYDIETEFSYDIKKYFSA